MARVELPPILLGVAKIYPVDFGDEMSVGETISTESVTASVYSGIDTSPSSLLSGAATKSGTVVSQLITTVGVGVAGVIYELLYTITTSLGQTLKKSGYLAILTDLP